MSRLAEAATFICGHPKSGTSLLAALLDSHPQLLVYPEQTGFFRHFLPQSVGAPFETRRRMAESSFLQIFHWGSDTPHPSQSDFPERDYTGIEFEVVRRAFQQFLGGMQMRDHNLLAAAVLAFGEVSGQSGPDTLRWVEKTPYNERYAEAIFETWPEARCLHLVRDPRDNFASYRRKHPEWVPAGFSLSWRRSVRLGRANRERYGRAHYLIIRFEDLVTETGVAMRAIGDFLGIRDDPALHQPTRIGRPWKGNSMFGERYTGVSDRPVGRWQRVLDDAEVTLLEHALRQEMQSLGYTPESVLSPLAVADWSWYRMKWKVGEWLGINPRMA